MQWLIHTVRALFARHTALGIAAVGVPVVALTALTVVAVQQLGGDEVAAAPDPVSATYTDDLLARADTTPDAFVDDVVDALLPSGLSAEVRAEALDRIGAALGIDDAAPASIADALVRRLGPVPDDVDTAPELIALLVAEIDPDGSITSLDELVAAIGAWSDTASAHVLRVTSGAAAGALAGLDAMTFEEAAAALDGLGTGMQVVEVAVPGVDGIERLDVPGVGWSTDASTRTITFTGATDDVGGRADAFVVARWDDRPRATILVGLRLSDWRLADAGFTGDLGDTRLPSTTFLLAGQRATLSSAAVGPVAWGFVSSDLASDRVVVIAPGVTALTRIDGSMLPTEVTDLLAGDRDLRLGVQATLGNGFGVVDGTATPSTASLAVEVPGLDPPALPSWIAPSDDLPWALTLTRTGNEATTIGLAGGLDVEVDGQVRPFAGRFGLSDDGEAAGRLDAELLEPWRAPFGVDWLDLDTLTMTVELSGSAGSARFAGDVVVAGRDARLTFEMASGGDRGSVRMVVATERLSAGDAVGLLSAATGAAPPAEVPDLSIEDVLIDVRAGAGTTVAIGGRASVAGQLADVFAGVESVGSSGSGIVIGVGLDSWKLADAVPAVSGTLLDTLEFPPSALVLSSLEGSVDPAELSEPAQRFFGGIDSSAPIRLVPGVSLFGSLDLAGTAVERPLAALGYDDGRFPVVGTLPGSVLGLGGGGSSGSALRDLSLAVQLPEISTAGAPDWFRGGRLSLVATGAPSLGLEGEMLVHVDGEDLAFVVGAEFARRPAGVELALYGELGTARPWESPFGVEWLTVNDLALQLSIDPIGTVGLGFGGSVVLGEHDVDVAIATEISAAGVPTNFAFEGASREGLAFSDLVAIQNRMAGAAGARPASLSGYPDLAIREVEIRFAPQPVERLGIEAGFALAGDVWIESGSSPVKFAALDVRLDERGLTAAGSLRAYDLGPIEWSDVALDLALTADDQHFRFDGDAAIFGIRAGASVDLSADSLFFTGREALNDIRRAVDLFERLVDDPVGTLTELDEIFRAAGVPTPRWIEELLDVVEPLVEQGADLTDEAIDVVLNGGTIPIVALPPGGDPPICLATTPIVGDDDRCYTTPPVPATAGIPGGGEAKECSRLTPLESGGRCYTIRPKGEVCLASFDFGGRTYGMQLRDGRCYAKIPKLTGGYRYLPSGGLAPTIDRGTPSGGTAKTCLVDTPIEVDGRCYTIPPTPAIPGTPIGGADRGCSLAWTEENGRCWLVPPSVAATGLGTPGLCTRFDVSCDLDDLVAGDIARALFDGVLDRLR